VSLCLALFGKSAGVHLGTCRVRPGNASSSYVPEDMYYKNDVMYFAFIFSKLLKHLKSKYEIHKNMKGHACTMSCMQQRV
jgi:hypothetical protein